MQTSAIPYRVADFLKEHPPFQGMEESDLLLLAQRGRVKFHDADEFLCWQGATYAGFLFVIQQGTVSLWEESEGTEKLVDIRGPGDVIGIERFIAADGAPPRWPYSAKATSEVVVYALNATYFGTLLGRYSHAAKYTQAHAAVRTDYQPPSRKRELHQMYVAELPWTDSPPTCATNDTIAQAAAKMLAAGSHSIALTNGDGLRILTVDDILHAVAAGTLDTSQPAASLASAAPAFVRPEERIGPAVMELARLHAPALAITSDGTPQGELHGWLDSPDLMPAFGDHPVSILRAIRRAGTTAALRSLLRRAHGFALEHLGGPAAVDWVATFLFEVDAAVAGRLLQLTGAAAEDSCWCFLGIAARCEHLTPSAPFLMRIASKDSTEGTIAVRDALSDCGYFGTPAVESMTLPEWEQRYLKVIRDPLNGGLAESVPYFDLRAFAGPAQPALDLAESVRAGIRESAAFLPLVANDCLRNLPPLTFFRAQVIDEEGQQDNVLRLEQTVLRPLADVGRVLGMAAGEALAGSTLQRFDAACRLLPEQAVLFRQAADTLRIALHLQALTGLRLGTDGENIPPEWLSRQDRQTLKTGFRTILKLLEFTADLEWLKRT